MRLVVIVIALWSITGSASADIGKQKCKDPKNFVFNATQGCVKRPKVRPKTPQENYVQALDAVDDDAKKAATLFEQACTAKYAPACLQLGLLHQSGRGRAVTKDLKRALELYEKGCTLGDGPSCQKRGDQARQAGEQPTARMWFTRGCDKDDGNACAYLALMLDKGYGGDKDVAQAKVKYDKAHKLMEAQCPGNGLACFLRGYFFENGLGIKADEAKALEAYRKGCNDSFGDACWKVAKILDRTKGDAKEAIAMYERSCELETADGCSEAAGRLSDLDHAATHPIELAERGCHLDTKECGVLAQIVKLGRGGRAPDQVKATQIFKTTCDAGDHYICVTYAQRLKDGSGVPKPDLAGAEKVLEGACSEDEETACLKLGQWLHDAKSDDARAFKFVTRACTLQAPRGCFLAAWMVRYDRRGAKGGLDKAAKASEALVLAEKGCELGSGNACTEAGELHEEAGDVKTAFAWFEKGCAASEDQVGTSCQYVARYHAQGKLGTKDPKGTLAAAIRVCLFDGDKCDWVGGTVIDDDDVKLVDKELSPSCVDRSYHAACMAVGQALLKGSSSEKRRGRELLGATCKKGHARSCFWEADAIYRGIGGDEDHALAEKLWKSQCDDKDKDACFQIAFYHRHDDGQLAQEFSEKACALAHEEGCNLAGFVHYTGMKPVKWDMAKAVTFYAKACELGSSSACGNMGEVYRFGLGTKADPKKAHEHYKRSCDAGSQYGCGGYAHYVATGEGGAKQDLAAAEQLYRAACEADTLESCAELAKLLEQRGKGTIAEIAKLKLRAFQLAEDQSKTNPEYMYFLGTFHRDGIATMKDEDKALELFGKACDSFDPFGCIAAGKMLVAHADDKSRSRAKVYFERACIAGVEDGCLGVKEADRPLVTAGPNPAVVQPKGCGCRGEVAPGGTAGGLVLVGFVLLRLRRRRA